MDNESCQSPLGPLLPFASGAWDDRSLPFEDLRNKPFSFRKRTFGVSATSIPAVRSVVRIRTSLTSHGRPATEGAVFLTLARFSKEGSYLNRGRDPATWENVVFFERIIVDRWPATCHGDRAKLPLSILCFPFSNISEFDFGDVPRCCNSVSRLKIYRRSPGDQRHRETVDREKRRKSAAEATVQIT